MYATLCLNYAENSFYKMGAEANVIKNLQPLFKNVPKKLECFTLQAYPA
jgi:hypothetical protein